MGTTEDRREKGTGSFREKRPGYWEVRIGAGKDPVTGKPLYASRTVRGDAKAAEKALDHLAREVRLGQHSATRDTLAHLLDDYLRFLEQRGRKTNTLRTYRMYVRTHIEPALGDIPLARLTARHVDRLYGDLLDGGMKPASVRQVHAIIRGALAQANRWDLVPANVAAKATPPTVPERDLAPPTPAQVRQLLDAADDPTFAAFIAVAATTGARRSELTRLRRSNIDLAAGTARIHGTKTGKFRTVALDPFTVHVLTIHLAWLEQRAADKEQALDPDPWVFSRRADATTAPDPMWFTHEFERVRRLVGLNHVRLHDLRHFVASYLIGGGQDPRTVAGRLGHADPSMTLRVYSHVIADRDVAAAAAIGALVAPPADQAVGQP